MIVHFFVFLLLRLCFFQKPHHSCSPLVALLGILVVYKNVKGFPDLICQINLTIFSPNRYLS
ncbi:hypothetical protein WZ342_2513 [Enterococcus faecalis]|nr:hypothetical protein WZ342_2513 [Enterococcus faecalis]